MAAGWCHLFESTGNPKFVIIGKPNPHAPKEGARELS